MSSKLSNGSNTKPPVPAAKDSDSYSYQLPTDGDDEKDINWENSKESNTTPSNISSSQTQSNNSKIAKEKKIENLKTEVSKPCSIEMVVKNKHVSENKENFIPNNLVSWATNSKIKEGKIKQSEIIPLKSVDESKGLKIKQKSVNTNENLNKSKDLIKVQDEHYSEILQQKVQSNLLCQLEGDVRYISYPLLTQEEREYATCFGYSFDSKKIDYTIGLLGTQFISLEFNLIFVFGFDFHNILILNSNVFSM